MNQERPEEESKARIGSQLETIFRVIPWAALEDELPHVIGSILRQGAWYLAPLCQSCTGGWRGEGTPPRGDGSILCREISHRLAGPYKQTSYALDFYSSFISKSKYLNILQIESQLRKDFDKREYCPQVLYSRIDSFNYLLSATVYLKMW